MKLYYIFVLRNYRAILIPKDVVALIISMIPNDKIFCGKYCTTFIRNDIYICGKGQVHPIKKVFIEGNFYSMCYTLNEVVTISESRDMIYVRSIDKFMRCGDVKKRYVPQNYRFDSGTKIMSVNSGSHHIIVMTESGEIYGGGHNEYGLE
ncbi:MAG TPA: hypothetical protein VKR58_01675 [Aquella sp.]|nr:hypothetical protein [Aquella sp.]